MLVIQNNYRLKFKYRVVCDACLSVFICDNTEVRSYTVWEEPAGMHVKQAVDCPCCKRTLELKEEMYKEVLI